MKENKKALCRNGTRLDMKLCYLGRQALSEFVIFRLIVSVTRHMYLIPTQQAILDTLHFCLDFVIIHALYDLYYPVSMDYTDLLLSNRYHR